MEIISARRDAASDAREGSGHSGDFVAQQLALRARFLGPRMVPLGEPLRGVLAQGAEARVPVEVRTGHCYRFVTAGGVDVEDLDVSLVSPSGLTVEQEEGREPFAVLGRQPLCPPLTGDYTLVVRMARGNGQWGVLRVGTP